MKVPGFWRWATGGVGAFAAGMLLARGVLGCGDGVRLEDEGTRLSRLARAAVGEDEAACKGAIGALRASGQAGLDAFLATHEAGLSSKEAARIREAADAIAGQKDASASRLFWHTDLAEAVRRAGAEGKPVLSLRLLGRLDEGFC